MVTKAAIRPISPEEVRERSPSVDTAVRNDLIQSVNDAIRKQQRELLLLGYAVIPDGADQYMYTGLKMNIDNTAWERHHESILAEYREAGWYVRPRFNNNSDILIFTSILKSHQNTRMAKLND